MLSVTGCNPKVSKTTLESCADLKSPTVNINATRTVIGTNDAYPEERERKVDLTNYDIDTTEVTNAQFDNFIQATGYITTAEQPQPGSKKAGGAVFRFPTDEDPNWWQFVEGANWRNPEGPNTDILGRENYPVVQISLVDANAYAKWIGRSLPNEAQWEYAARAGSNRTFIWGNELSPNGVQKANTWQGAFPIQNTKEDGYDMRSPVGCFEPNAFGLHDMIGNVWEWTTTKYEYTRTPNSYTIKGGSFLCAPNFCARYRAPARQAQEADFSTNHIGFRTVGKVD